MVERDPRLPRPGGGLAEPAGVGELEGNDEIVIGTVGLPVSGADGVEEQAEAVAPQGGGDELARVGPPGGDDRHRLPSPHELRPADPEVAPPSQEWVGGEPVGGGVPALHRVDGPAVAHHSVADRHRPRQRRALGGREDRLVDRQGGVERRPMSLERGDRSEAGGAREHGNGDLPRAERESMGEQSRYAPGAGTPSPATSSAAGADGRLPPACSEWRGVVVFVVLSAAMASPSSPGFSVETRARHRNHRPRRLLPGGAPHRPRIRGPRDRAPVEHGRCPAHRACQGYQSRITIASNPKKSALRCFCQNVPSLDEDLCNHALVASLL